VQGNKLNDDNAVVLALYGPQGGTRAIETLSLASAGNLVKALLAAIETIEQKTKE
jgi:hypothetical protein